MLIKDMDRKTERLNSEINPSAGAPAGVSSAGTIRGTMFDNRMPAIRHGTNSGNLMLVA